MKLTKIYSGIMALLFGAAMLTACSDTDDYYANNGTLLTDGAVVTGSSDVTATTATFHGTVTGLENMNTASYSTGFKYGFAQNALTETATAASASEFSATLSGLVTNTTIYYQAFVTLQGKLTYTGEVKSLITTDATAVTGAATGIDYAEATLAGSISKYPADAVAGIVISTSNDEEDVRAGLRLTIDGLAENYEYTQEGLLPGTTYYYAAFLDLGAGVVYGEVKSFRTDAHDVNVDDEFVDLGLSVKWAKHNIGAKDETDLGGYFAFGDLSGTNPSIDPADYASADVYKTTQDLAYQALGGKGTLPTAAEFEELFSMCDVVYNERDGIPGYLVMAKNGNSIFLPAAGKRVGHDIQDAGSMGYYLTGSVNATNPKFAVDYEFSAQSGARATRATYEALSVRPVSTARNVKFDKSLLYQKWYLDNGQDGKQHVWEGPFTQWGKTDNWGTVTNNEPNPYQSIHWEMGTGNGWIGYTYGVDYGYMEFKEDGTVFIHRLTDDNKATDETGTFTINERDKTITIDINVLCANTWVAVKSGTLNILSLTEDAMQIGILNNDDYQYSLNYYSQKKADKDAAIKVNLICVGNDWGGSWGSEMDAIAPEKLDGQHTFTYNGACNGLKVNTIDFVGLRTRFPNAFVRIDEIKLDGTSIKFNANNFCYGDIEDNGNFRIEIANVWGKTAKNEKIIASPFSNLTDTDNDPAFTFANSLEVTYTIFTEGPEKTYKPNLITINPDWGGPWDYNDGAAFDVTLNKETAKYELSKNNFTITYNSDIHAAGSIMTFIEIADIYGYFPTMHSTLNSLKLDGNSVSFDASKVVDTSEGAKYRLELWNCYGATGSSECAFGTRDGDVIHELGFSSSMQLDFTINSLFAVPQF
jgi:hypothetical protein